jgi:GMP synthase (glutamine-hydrolysing)
MEMTLSLRFLVVEGNVRAIRERHRESYGRDYGDSYGDVLVGLAPGSTFDVAYPADEGANIPDADGLVGYDGIVLTGSALHLWKREPETMRQIAFARAIFRSKVPMFGSCWGLQVASAAAGGDVQMNPKGREAFIARNLYPTEAGKSHPLLRGRALAYDAPCVHLDIVTVPPGEVTVLATNANTPMQAAEIRHDGGTFWGVQYHPEFDLRTIAAIARRYTSILIEEGKVRSEAEVEVYADDMIALNDDRTRSDIAWKYGLGDDILDDDTRLTEIRNFIELRVKPDKSKRGRA